MYLSKNKYGTVLNNHVAFIIVLVLHDPNDLFMYTELAMQFLFIESLKELHVGGRLFQSQDVFLYAEFFGHCQHLDNNAHFVLIVHDIGDFTGRESRVIPAFGFLLFVILKVQKTSNR